MDTYARLLTSKTALPNDSQYVILLYKVYSLSLSLSLSLRLADALLLVSTEHFEPWLVKTWSIVRKSTWKESSASIPSLNVLLNKVIIGDTFYIYMCVCVCVCVCICVCVSVYIYIYIYISFVYFRLSKLVIQ